jgi:uncharacterized membrane protein
VTERGAEPGTNRLEAFSDGVFAIAITILAFELRVPPLEHGAPAAALVQSLLRIWPAYVAFLSSFATILIMWVSHHNLFRTVRRTNNTFMYLNGMLLLVVTAVPFPTGLVGTYLLEPGGSVASAIYGAVFFLISLVFHFVWSYARRAGLLAGPPVHKRLGTLNGRFFVGPACYLAAAALSLANEFVGLAICVAMTIFYAALSYERGDLHRAAAPAEPAAEGSARLTPGD